MLTLTEDEKKQLEGLKEHPWMKVAIKIAKDEEDKLARSILITYNLDNEEDREEVKNLKIYNEARKDFLAKLATKGASIYVPETNV